MMNAPMALRAKPQVNLSARIPDDAALFSSVRSHFASAHGAAALSSSAWAKRPIAAPSSRRLPKTFAMLCGVNQRICGLNGSAARARVISLPDCARRPGKGPGENERRRELFEQPLVHPMKILSAAADAPGDSSVNFAPRHFL